VETSKFQHEITQWLAGTALVGDLILTGQHDRVSRWIQRATNSTYSHAAVVTGPFELTEAFDYALTFSEDDEGVYQTDFETFIKRSKRLADIAIYRPHQLDHDRLEWTADALHENTPTYPTTAALMFIGGQLTRRMTNQAVPRRRRPPPQRIRRHANFFGDGPRRVHCAELATRLYAASGAFLDFRHPLLGPYIDVVNGVNDYLADGLPSPITKGRGKPKRGLWAPKGTRRGKRLLIATCAGITDLTGELATRMLYRLQGDIADYIMPGDLTAARPLNLIARRRFNPRGHERHTSTAPPAAYVATETGSP